MERVGAPLLFVEVTRTAEGKLGFLINRLNAVVELVAGSSAATSGLLRVGDVFATVDGEELCDRYLPDVIDARRMRHTFGVWRTAQVLARFGR